MERPVWVKVAWAVSSLGFFAASANQQDANVGQRSGNAAYSRHTGKREKNAVVVAFEWIRVCLHLRNGTENRSHKRSHKEILTIALQPLSDWSRYRIRKICSDSVFFSFRISKFFYHCNWANQFNMEDYFIFNSFTWRLLFHSLHKPHLFATFLFLETPIFNIVSVCNSRGNILFVHHPIK